MSKDILVVQAPNNLYMSSSGFTSDPCKADPVEESFFDTLSPKRWTGYKLVQVSSTHSTSIRKIIPSLTKIKLW